MSRKSSFKRLVKSALPRPIIDRIRASADARRRDALARKLVTAPEAFARAYETYWQSGIVPDDAEELLFLATWESSGTLPRSLVERFAPTFDPASFSAFQDDVLRSLDPMAAAHALEQDGYFIAPDRLPAEVVDDILGVLESGPADPRGDAIAELTAGPPRPGAPTWWMQPHYALRSRQARHLLTERRIAEVAGRYLGVDPMIMSIVLWESFAWEAADRKSAQEFHYDNDRASFVKMFVYLTDVGLDNGPHTYVPRSHGTKPKDLLHGDRLPDEAVAAHYPEDTWKVVTGERGTYFFADTQGFHKGGRVVEGKRAMFQINLSSDRFGVHEPPVGDVSEAPDDLRPMIERAPRFFSQLFAGATRVP